MERGIYTLVLLLDRDMHILVGSLGEILFNRGYYSYTGSARGPGGLKRIARHRDVICGINQSRRWHIDYLLPQTSLIEIASTPTLQDLECQIANSIGKELAAVPNFGSTDCKCLSHLHYSRDLDQMLDVVWRAHEYSCRGVSPLS